MTYMIKPKCYRVYFNCSIIKWCICEDEEESESVLLSAVIVKLFMSRLDRISRENLVKSILRKCR